MNVEIKYTDRGQRYIKEFPTEENKIIVRLNEYLKSNENKISVIKERLLLNKIVDICGIPHSFYGYIYKNGDTIILEIEMISTTIKSKEYDSSETLVKARKI